MKIKACIITLLATSLIGCANTKDYEYLSPTHNILSGSIEKSKSNTFKASPDKKIALILSTNTKQSIANQEAIVKHNEWMIDSVLYAGLDDFLMAQKEANNPRFEVSYIASSLKEKLHNIKLISSIDEFYNQTYSALVIIDIYRKFDNGWSTFDEIFNVRTDFYDEKLHYISTSRSNNTVTLPHKSVGGSDDSYTIKVHQVILNGLSEWERNLGSVVN